MVEPSRRNEPRRRLMSSHNRCWIWGRNVVLETLRAGRWPIVDLMIGSRVAVLLRNEVVRLADRNSVPVIEGTDQELTKACRSEEHQGFAARMAPYPCLKLPEFLRQLPATPAITLLDRLQDSFNLGAIIRSASSLGIDGLIIGEQEQSEINSQVARSSAGAVNHLPIARTSSLTSAIHEFRDRGFQIVAASEKATMSIFEADLRKPTVIVIGNEGRGIHADLLALCDVSVSIPMSGHVGSLNAAVAAGILFYEMRRQRSTQAPSRTRHKSE